MATVPAAPVIVNITNVTNTSVTVTMRDGVNGGAAINSRRIGYSLNPTAPTTYVAASLTQTISGLAQGKRYYFWAQTHNTVGWSALSPRKEVVTDTVPATPSIVLLSNVTQITVDVTLKANADNGSPITKMEIHGYVSIGSSIWNYTIPYQGKPTTIGPFRAGYKAYVRARAQNIYGYSPWSTALEFQTIAGLRYRAADLQPSNPWLRVVPYVYQDENWRLARPYVCSKGVWYSTD
jgi:hypothetical protein